jgi:hypothetical protein
MNPSQAIHLLTRIGRLLCVGELLLDAGRLTAEPSADADPAPTAGSVAKQALEPQDE